MRYTLNLQFPLGHHARLCSRQQKDEESSLIASCKMEFDSITLPQQPVCLTSILKKQIALVEAFGIRDDYVFDLPMALDLALSWVSQSSVRNCITHVSRSNRTGLTKSCISGATSSQAYLTDFLTEEL